ncbi:MAG TPA: hypothetical protein PKD27_12850 [Tepidiformaceae bacterium]|nr:hypothetical protein [Tepidiformaceae bacterium]
MADKIYIFDTTLRDGEQSAGVAFTPQEKLEIARQLERLGVDIIEAGFPCSTPGDLEAVQTISREVRNTTICALARAVKTDIDTAWEAVKEAADPRIHVFINTSDIQMAHQLGKDREQVLTQAEALADAVREHHPGRRDGEARRALHQQRRIQPHGRHPRRPALRV